MCCASSQHVVEGSSGVVIFSWCSAIFYQMVSVTMCVTITAATTESKPSTTSTTISSATTPASTASTLVAGGVILVHVVMHHLHILHHWLDQWRLIHWRDCGISLLLWLNGNVLRNFLGDRWRNWWWNHWFLFFSFSEAFNNLLKNCISTLEAQFVDCRFGVLYLLMGLKKICHEVGPCLVGCRFPRPSSDITKKNGLSWYNQVSNVDLLSFLIREIC